MSRFESRDGDESHTTSGEVWDRCDFRAYRILRSATNATESVVVCSGKHERHAQSPYVL